MRGTFLPITYLVRGKVIFSKLSVILSTGGGSLSQMHQNRQQKEDPPPSRQKDLAWKEWTGMTAQEGPYTSATVG